jgi:hypothetical protein
MSTDYLWYTGDVSVCFGGESQFANALLANHKTQQDL